MPSDGPAARDLSLLVPPPPLTELGRQEADFLDFMDAIGEPGPRIVRAPLQNIVPNIPDTEFVSDDEEDEEDEEQPEGVENMELWDHECLCDDPGCDCLLFLNNEQ